MEKAMFSAYWAKSTMHATIEHLSTLDGWKESVAIMKQSFGRKKDGGYIKLRCAPLKLNDGCYIEKPPLKAENMSASKSKPLDRDIRVAMEKSKKDLELELGTFHCPEVADFQDRITIRDHEFTTYRTSESHGVVFFQEASHASSLVPGMVRAIFKVTQDRTAYTFLAVHRYLAPAASLPNPFARYPDFGANIWSSETQREVTIVPVKRRIYHAIYRDWEYKLMVMKPLNKVSNTVLK
jgi:hypothetical protein